MLLHHKLRQSLLLSPPLSTGESRPPTSSTACFVPFRSAGVALAVARLHGAPQCAAFATGAGFSNQYRSIGEEGGPDYWTKLGVEKKKKSIIAAFRATVGTEQRDGHKLMHKEQPDKSRNPGMVLSVLRGVHPAATRAKRNVIYITRYTELLTGPELVWTDPSGSSHIHKHWLTTGCHCFSEHIHILMYCFTSLILLWYYFPWIQNRTPLNPRECEFKDLLDLI